VDEKVIYHEIQQTHEKGGRFGIYHLKFEKGGDEE
jgi:hypothetical protein